MRCEPSLIAFILMGSILLADEPTSRPAETRSLGNGLITYIAPENWTPSDKDNNPDVDLLVSADRKGSFQINLEPKNASCDDAVAGAIVRKLREMRSKSGDRVLMPAKLERDKRFNIRIHERFIHNNVTHDQLHLYRQLGPRVVDVVSLALTDNEDEAKSLHSAGETALAGAKYVKPRK